jgi:hypothetical protein
MSENEQQPHDLRDAQPGIQNEDVESAPRYFHYPTPDTFTDEEREYFQRYDHLIYPRLAKQRHRRRWH